MAGALFTAACSHTSCPVVRYVAQLSHHLLPIRHGMEAVSLFQFNSQGGAVIQRSFESVSAIITRLRRARWRQNEVGVATSAMHVRSVGTLRSAACTGQPLQPTLHAGLCLLRRRLMLVVVANGQKASQSTTCCNS